MRIKVAYCGRVRKDGSVNQVTFDTEKRVFTDNYITHDFIFVEAKLSKDVDGLRYKLIKDGYEEMNEI